MKFERPYEQELFESGEAALKVLHTMVDAETQFGNNKNIPISIMVIYLLSLVPQLMKMEDEQAPLEDRAQKAHVIDSCMRLMTHRNEDEGNAAVAYAKQQLAERSLPVELIGGMNDTSYGGQISSPFAPRTM
jgi:hypothetical protein